MTHSWKALGAAALVLISLIAGSGGPAAASAPVAGPGISAAHGLVALPGGATTQDLGPWTALEWPFRSYATCESRAATVLRIYGGTHYGAVRATRCAGYALPQCPPRTVIALFVRYEIGVGGGGGGGWSVEPKSQPQAVCPV